MVKVETTADRLLVEVDLEAQIERVWAALTSPDAVRAWWGDHVQLVPEVGGHLRETWTDEAGRVVVTSGVVTRCDRPTSLAMTWADDDWPGTTEVEFTLAERPVGRTLLRLEHAGWDALPAGRRGELIEGHAAGWRGHLASLRAFLLRQRSGT